MLDTINIHNFKFLYDSSHVQIKLDESFTEYAVVFNESYPGKIDLKINSLSYEKIHNNTITCLLAEGYYEQSSIIYLLKESESKVYYLELLRQSEEDLWNKFQYKKPGGYTILSRTNLVLPNEQIPIFETAIQTSLNELPLPKLKPTFETHIPSLNLALDVIKEIWQSHLSCGPSNKPPKSITCPVKRLHALRLGEVSTMCSDVSALFINLSVLYGLKARSVKLYAYYPPFDDLITFSHALAEVYSPELNKWLAIDPWYSFYMKSEKLFLSIEEILPINNKEEINLNFVLPKRKAFFQEACIRSYWDYFGTTIYGPEEQSMSSFEGQS
ncbi:MAG: transglutaminase domain-containing protein [Lentisphaeraceae bacterium]|nr:transglutaminase domain-containing protein [Lentisphaeraceae bacterium]